MSGFIPFTMGALLIYGLIGFVVLAGTIWQLIIGWVERDGIRNTRFRQAWLEHWFGVDGAKRWMEHEDRVVEVRRLKKHQPDSLGYRLRMIAINTRMKREGEHCYDPYPKLLPNGRVIGTIYWDQLWWDRGTLPPWGKDCDDVDKYWLEHHPPKALDWFAAGYWDKGVEAAWEAACNSSCPDWVIYDPAFYQAAAEEHKKREVLRKEKQKGLFNRMMAPNAWADGLKERLRKEAEANQDPQLAAFVKHKVGANSSRSSD